jgi:hypothetical protein
MEIKGNINPQISQICSDEGADASRGFSRYESVKVRVISGRALETWWLIVHPPVPKSHGGHVADGITVRGLFAGAHGRVAVARAGFGTLHELRSLSPPRRGAFDRERPALSGEDVCRLMPFGHPISEDDIGLGVVRPQRQDLLIGGR